MISGSIQSKEWQGGGSCGIRSRSNDSGIGRSRWSSRSIRRAQRCIQTHNNAKITKIVIILIKSVIFSLAKTWVDDRIRQNPYVLFEFCVGAGGS